MGIAFIVVMASAIDIPLRLSSDLIGFANELEQTNVFLSRYPDAEVFVYKPRCTPLTECPGPTIEYVYEGSANIATFRVQIQPSERVVTFMQVHCAASERDTFTLYGPTVQTQALVDYLDLDRCPDSHQLQSVFPR